MSEAKNLQDPLNKKDPEVYAESYPIIQELHVDALPISERPTSITSHTSSKTKSGLTTFAEHFATFILKFFIISITAFAVGAYLTISVLMDRIDHKSGWLKDFLQFIRETSKYLIK